MKLQQQVNPRMSSPIKRPREEEASESLEKQIKAYHPSICKNYTDEEFKIVQQVQGVDNKLPEINFNVNPDGNSISLTVDGCPEGMNCLYARFTQGATLTSFQDHTIKEFVD